MKNPVVELSQTVDEADALLIPHNYNLVRNNTKYLASFEDLAEKSGKKILIFFPGDSAETVPIANAVIFRNSQYRYSLKDNEIILQIGRAHV